jgi:hypothetical protein
MAPESATDLNRQGECYFKIAQNIILKGTHILMTTQNGLILAEIRQRFNKIGDKLSFNS